LSIEIIKYRIVYIYEKTIVSGIGKIPKIC